MVQTPKKKKKTGINISEQQNVLCVFTERKTCDCHVGGTAVQQNYEWRTGGI
jgi:hypothetical protein